MKTVPRRNSTQKFLPKEKVDSSFKKYALKIDDNGEEVQQISCLKPGRPCAEVYKVLEEQMMFFSEQQNTDNPFEITESDVEDAQFADNIISDDEDDVALIEKLTQTVKNLFLLIFLISFVFKKKP